jgi:hypothetical protein
VAAENILSREVVELVSRGVERVEADINRVRAATGGVADAATRARQFVSQLGASMGTAFGQTYAGVRATFYGLRQMHRQLSALGQVARTFTFGGAFGIGALVTAAARGTVEGENFGRVMQAAARIVGGSFAPYVRFATQGVVDLVKWFQTLSPEVKANAAHWALTATAIAGFLAAAPVVVTVASAVVGALTALLNPFVAIPLAVAGAVAAFLYLTAEGDTFAEKMESIVGRLIGAWSAFGVAMKFVAQEVAAVWQALMHQFSLFALVTDKALHGDITGAAAAMAGAQAVGRADLEKIFGGGDGLAGRIRKAVEEGGRAFDAGKQQGKDLVGDIAGRITEFIKSAKELWEGVSKAPFTPKFNSGFESSETSIDRLSKAINEMDTVDVQKQQLDEMKKVNDKLNQFGNQFGKVADAIPAIR